MGGCWRGPQRLSEKERAYIRVSIDHAETVERRKLRQRRITTGRRLRRRRSLLVSRCSLCCNGKLP